MSEKKKKPAIKLGSCGCPVSSLLAASKTRRFNNLVFIPRKPDASFSFSPFGLKTKKKINIWEGLNPPPSEFDLENNTQEITQFMSKVGQNLIQLYRYNTR